MTAPSANNELLRWESPGGQCNAARHLLYCEPNPAPANAVSRYFGPPRFPGTTSIGERRRHPELFQDTLDSPLENYHDWLRRSLTRTAKALFNGNPILPMADHEKEHRIQQFVSCAEEVLDYQTDNGEILADFIPQQLYEDMFIRILIHVGKSRGITRTPHLYRDFNALGQRLALSLLHLRADETVSMDDETRIDLLIRISVLSGHIGINLKSSASAASSLLNRDLIPLPKEWIASPSTVTAVPAHMLEAVARQVMRIAESAAGRFAISSVRDYFTEVVNTSVPTLLVFLSDDFLESIIDLQRFETMLARNPDLMVLFVPRAGQYGNDLSYNDARMILEEPRWVQLRALIGEGRFRLSAHGPRAGCIDPRDISRLLIEEIDMLGGNRRIILETKGCRNFEMVRGRLMIPWYAAFNCNRALSIRTVGVDGPPVFLRIPPGLNAFEGFELPTTGRSPSFPHTEVRFARMTTRRLFTALTSPSYREGLKNIGDELAFNQRIVFESRQRKMTLAEYLEG